jgi:NADH-quinone oxidoreductase subunit D
MPESYAEQYFPVLVQALLAMALAAGLLTVSWLLGKRIRNRVKDTPYESGMRPTGNARERFSVKFYLVAPRSHRPASLLVASRALRSRLSSALDRAPTPVRLKCRSGRRPKSGDRFGDSVWRGPNWYEREVFDMFGIRLPQSSQPGSHPDAARLGRLSAAQGLSGARAQVQLPERVGRSHEKARTTRTHYPAEPGNPARPAAPRRMTLNMGPQHPSTHGVLRIVLELEGETIRKAVPDIGFLHTGIEKQCEVKTWQQVVTLTDRVDYLSNLSNNLVYALAVEKLLAHRDSAEGAMDARDAGGVFAPQQPSGVAGDARAGHRRDDHVLLLLPRARRHPAHLRDVLRPAHDDQLHPHRRAGAGAAARLAEAVGKFIRGFPARWTSTKNLLNNESHLEGAHARRGLFPLEDMLDLGVTGPMIRAAGMKRDVRKTEPYSSYDKFDFEVATQHRNDVYARYRVRMEEMRQSARIITQALEGMPEGPWQADAPHVCCRTAKR